MLVYYPYMAGFITACFVLKCYGLEVTLRDDVDVGNFFI